MCHLPPRIAARMRTTVKYGGCFLIDRNLTGVPGEKHLGDKERTNKLNPITGVESMNGTRYRQGEENCACHLRQPQCSTWLLYALCYSLYSRQITKFEYDQTRGKSIESFEQFDQTGKPGIRSPFV